VVVVIIVVDRMPRCQSASETSHALLSRTMLTLRAHVVLRAKMLHLLGKGTDIARSHSARADPWAARSRKRRAHPLHTSEVGLVVVERIGVGPSESKLPRLDVLEAERLPVQELGQSLSSVSLVDTLSSRLSSKVEHLVRLS